MARDCVCGRSSKFPYCDGTHNRLNRLNLQEPARPDLSSIHGMILDDGLPYKIYKNLMPEETRVRLLNMMKTLGQEFWHDSSCTNDPVDQLRIHMPRSINNALYEMQINNYKDWGNLFKVNVLHPEYSSPNGHGRIVDRRGPGAFLGKHQDIPTGDFSKYFGAASGESGMEFTQIFYWNDDFKGGELVFNKSEFIKDDIIYRPTAGDVIVFRSFHEHEILPVISGNRYSSQQFYYNINMMNSNKK